MLYHAMSRKVIHRVAMTLSRGSASVAGATSRHVIRCGKASQLRSLEASPLQYHVTRRGFNGCFAGAWLLSLAMDGTPAVPSMRALQHEWQAESNHPVDIPFARDN